MHGRNKNNMAESGGATGLKSRSGCPQRADAGRSLVSRIPQHGGGMADSVEPETTQGTNPITPTPNMGCVGTDGDRVAHSPPKPGIKEHMAPMGKRTGYPAEEVCPQEQAGVIGTKVTTGNVLNLLATQEYRCALTGRELTPETASLDHIVPIRCGGEHVIENTQVLHKDVNRAKGSRTNIEFVGLCREIVRYMNTHSIEDRGGAE